jgi:peptidoglycan hydrolase-like protein with peptidoglycan-binding domain
MNSAITSTRARAPGGGGRRLRGRVVLATLLLVVLILPLTAASASASGTTSGSLTSQSENLVTLKKIRVGRHDGFDRVVFEFAGGLPEDWTVQYKPVARTDGAGAPIPTMGTAALQVNMVAESVDIDAPGAPLTFTPTTPIAPGFPTLRHVRFGGYFEGGTTFGIGVKARTAFRVSELTGPPRLVIDVRHGAVVRNLRTGHRGVDVRDWQHRLNLVQFGQFASSPGHSQGRLTADGIFGTMTYRATRTFQREEGLTVTGVVNSATRSAMYRALVRSSQIRP